jgi:arsenite methyltransferase
VKGKEIMEKQDAFFDFAAEVGFTKHIGGLQATDALLKLCCISKDSVILDVGCGAGVTPVNIAKQYGCRVFGVDISERMIQRSIQRAAKEKVMDKVEFRTADAQELPFEDDFFDAVITESVTAFPEDKQKAVNEYARVTKPGGYVGLNESTWLRSPPTPEMIAWVSQDIGGSASPLTSEEWTGLLETAGLKNIVARTSEIDVQNEARGIFRRYGFGGMLTVWSRMLSLYIRNPSYREFVKGVGRTGIVPQNLEIYFGYGLYVGQK